MPASHRLITDRRALDDLIAEIAGADEYTVDTEFHRERSYFPKVALVQLGWPGGNVALVDPLAVDLAPLVTVLEGPGTAIMHAGNQDLEVLHRACGTAVSYTHLTLPTTERV